MTARARQPEITDNLADLLHPDSRAGIADPDGVLEEAAARVYKACAAMRALADLTAGESQETTTAHLAEVRREDMGSLLSLIEEHLHGSLQSIDGVIQHRLDRRH